MDHSSTSNHGWQRRCGCGHCQRAVGQRVGVLGRPSRIGRCGGDHSGRRSSACEPSTTADCKSAIADRSLQMTAFDSRASQVAGRSMGAAARFEIDSLLGRGDGGGRAAASSVGLDERRTAAQNRRARAAARCTQHARVARLLWPQGWPGRWRRPIGAIFESVASGSGAVSARRWSALSHPRRTGRKVSRRGSVVFVTILRLSPCLARRTWRAGRPRL